MKKRTLLVSALAAATLSLGVLSGCFLTTVSVTSIEKTNSVGLVDYYTITYSDGTTSQFTVTNGKDGTDGKDGKDAKDVTAEDVYNTYKSIYKDEELSYKEFCEKYLTLTNDDGNAALNSCLRSCLKVYTVFKERQLDDYGRYKTLDTVYTGSAVVYKMEEEYTYLLTNYHVIYDYDAVSTSKFPIKMWAYLYGSEGSPVKDEYTGDVSIGVNDKYAIACEYVGGEISYDVAAIKVKTKDLLEVNPQATPVQVNHEYKVGDSVYAVGNTNGEGISVTKGIISVDSDQIKLKLDNKTRVYRSVRTDTAISHGNSGGGLFNTDGELIALNNAGSTTVTSMNYAIPASILTGIADGILYYNDGGTHTALLGVNYTTQNSRYVYDEDTGKSFICEDVKITAISSGDNIASALSLAKDDIIRGLTINGTTYRINRDFEITDLLFTVRARDKISIIYERGGNETQTQTFTVRATDIIEIAATKNIIED